MKENTMNLVQEYANLISKSFTGVRKKEVKALNGGDFDLFEMAYKALVVLERSFGPIPVQDRPRHKYWTAIKPMTNIAGAIGNDVLIGKQRDEDDITKKNETRFKVGWHLLNILFDSGILEVTRESKRRSRDRYKLRVTKGMEDTFEDFLFSIDEFEEDIPIYNKPQYEEPEPYTEYYHPHAGPLVRNPNPEAINLFTNERMPLAYEAINKHMKVAYVINLDVLNVYTHCMEDDLLTFAKKDLTKEQRDGLERERDQVIKEASKVGDRTFWEFMFYDYRSRMYSASAYLSHAGSKLSKSLFLYDDPRPITKGGWFWLMVHAANCFGYDKDTIDGRHDFATSHLEEWMEIGKDPITNKLWQEAESPFEFLAVVMEIYKAIESGDKYNYSSGLAISWDASCSGLQVLSALARDEKSGQLCNLTNSTERGDYYLMIADKVWEECNYDDQELKIFERITLDLNLLEKKIKDASRKGTQAFRKAVAEKEEYFEAHKANILSASKVFWGRPEMKKLRRKVCKRPCMTYFYSCGVRSMSRAMMEDHASDTEEFGGLTSYYCFWLATRIFKACEDLMPVPTSLMKLFIDLGLDDYRKKKDFWIDAPYTNFRVMQYYRKDKTKQIDVMYKGRVIKPSVAIAKDHHLDNSKIASATSPNVVHMLDSQIVAAILIKADYTVSCIHDSFSTYAADAGKLYEDCRTSFVERFEEDLLMNLLIQKDSVEYYNEIKKGNLNLDDIYDNEYNFI